MWICKFCSHLFTSWCYTLQISCWYNPFRTIGSYLTHENWPLNWPNFAVWPVLPGWPAHSRHTVACMHRFSHILGLPPELTVLFMSEWRAVAIDQARKYEDLPIISSSFEMATVRKGLTNVISVTTIYLLNPSPEYRQWISNTMKWNSE